MELRAAEQLSHLSYTEYPRKNQIVLTSHSLAFVNPPDSIQFYRRLYRRVKNDLGETIVERFEKLHAGADRESIYDEIGVLEAKKATIQTWRIKESDSLYDPAMPVRRRFAVPMYRILQNALVHH